jgi:hypothetical protein
MFWTLPIHHQGVHYLLLYYILISCICRRTDGNFSGWSENVWLTELLHLKLEYKVTKNIECVIKMFSVWLFIKLLCT